MKLEFNQNTITVLKLDHFLSLTISEKYGNERNTQQSRR
jgi:hypothetical protein